MCYSKLFSILRYHLQQSHHQALVNLRQKVLHQVLADLRQKSQQVRLLQAAHLKAALQVLQSIQQAHPCLTRLQLLPLLKLLQLLLPLL